MQLRLAQGLLLLLADDLSLVVAPATREGVEETADAIARADAEQDQSTAH